MRTGIVVDVTAADRERLVAVVANRNSPQKHVWRAHVVLLTAEGCGTAEIIRDADVAQTNDDPNPYHWSKGPDKIIAAVWRGRQR
jgi:hypothetical protein